MKCQRCGKELKNSARCSFCGYEENVREMSNAEKNFYNGVTIDVDSGEKNYHRHNDSEYDSYGATFINFGGTNPLITLLFRLINGIFGGSLLAKIIAGVLFIVFAAFMFFVALPIFFVVIAVGIFVLVIVPRIKNKFRGRF